MRIKQPKTLLFILVFLVGGVISFILIKNLFLPKTPEIFVVGAKPHQPQKIRITNLSDNSFSVSWLTQKETQNSTITYYQKDSQTKTAEEENQFPSRTHQIDIQNLWPQTTYFFTILSEQETFKKENNEPFEAKTLKTTEKPPRPPFILTGSIRDDQGNPQTNVLVFFYQETINPLSVLTDNKGNFLFALNNARNKTDESYFVPQKGQGAKIMVETIETSYAKELTIEENLNLVVNPTEVKIPEAQVSEIEKPTFWQKLKTLIKAII